MDDYQESVPIFLRLGDWEVLLYASDSYAERQVRLLQDSCSAFLFDAPSSDLAMHSLVIITPAETNGHTFPSWLSRDEYPMWANFEKAWKAAYARFCQIRSLSSTQDNDARRRFTFCWSESKSAKYPTDPLDKKISGQFYLLIQEPNEEEYIGIFIYSLFLATQWHILQGGLCLHSAAVAQEHNGFLFLGASCAGKSTVSSLSMTTGYSVLGDDLNFITWNGENDYFLAAGPSVKPLPNAYATLRPLLRGIFTLIQDTSDYLVPLSPRQTASILFDSLAQTPSTAKLPAELVGCAFRTVCKIAHHIPGYELHFRKSPDFWQLIDERFPG